MKCEKINWAVWKKALIYAMCAVLLLFYVAVLLAPRNVCSEYELYYVSGELSEWPQYGGLDYELGEKLSFGSEDKSFSSKRKGKGWSNREEGFSWTDGKRADILFRFEYEGNMTAIINVGDRLCDSYDVLVNGNVVLEASQVSNGTLTVDIPNVSADENGLVYVTFVIHSPRRPGNNGDMRRLGIQLKEMTLVAKTAD